LVDLPLDREASEWYAHRPAWGTAKALLVEEYEPSRRVIEEQIAALGMGVESCASPAEALRRLREARQRGEPFRALLADCSLAPALQAEPLGDTALVALTSLDGMDQARRITEAGSTHYLFRPVRLGQLLEVLRNALAEPETTAPRPDSSQRPAPLPLVAAQVLLAEDNEVNQRIAVKMLERLGSRVDVAANGKEALEMLERRPYDLVFMDCQMPDMDGFQATAEIRRRHLAGRRLPIIAMTANAMAGDRDRCLAAGMDDYITKPASLQDLRTALNRWLATEQTTEPRP
jgi:CheY-like chemotaxis protein